MLLIVLVVDGRVGVTSGDLDVVRILHRFNKPILVAANKIDDIKFIDNIYEFYNLGIDEVFAISALHGIGIGDLLDKIVELLPEKKLKRYDNTLEFSLIG